MTLEDENPAFDWGRYSEVEQGALLLDLADFLLRYVEQSELDQGSTDRYLAFAHAAHQAGRALLDNADLPFDPDPPFRWSKIPLEEVMNAVMMAPINPILVTRSLATGR